MAEQGVKHFEDLSAKDILEFLSRPQDFTATEKLDGSNIIVGRDEKGIYTRRERKEKYYSVDDYETSFFTNYQKIALAAVLDSEKRIGMILDIGEEVGAEVIVGTQPNVVTYLRNENKTTIVLFKKSDNFRRCTGTVCNIELLEPKKNSYFESNTAIKTVDYVINTIDEYDVTSILDYKVGYLPELLTSYQEIAGVEMQVREILDWPLNKKNPATFDRPWKEVKDEFKAVRLHVKELIRQQKRVLFPRVHSNTRGLISEGYVFTNGNIEFKLVDQQVFLNTKTFIWKFRDLIKAARNRAGDITTLDQVNALRNKYTDLIDKYEAEKRFTISMVGIGNIEYQARRSVAVVERDRTAFINAFEELSRIESEIKRNNRING